MVGIGGARELETVEHRERVQSRAAFNHSSSVISDNTPSYDTEKPYCKLCMSAQLFVENCLLFYSVDSAAEFQDN